MNIIPVNPNRVVPRHVKRTKCNLLFIDGHAETVDGSSIPPSFDLPTLSQAGYAWPRWRLDQP